MQVLIADDEMLTLDLMKNIINWESKGMKIAGAVLNGREAQKIIEERHIDILITDIKMPEIDGINLIKWVRSNHTGIKIVIISAYGEFEYAKEALSLGVMGYLLKPIDELELEQLLDKIIAGLEEERDIERKLQKVLGSGIDETKSESNMLIQKAKEYIKLYYNTDISLEALCNSICVSKNYFCYLFKREVGESIWDYLTRYRIEKAKELLKTTDMKNYEVAYRIGYENSSYFTKTFKRLTGYTPQEYRDSN